ncbi:MAG: hypothetical protein GKR89_27940 [Candidatus Latescibacteria bacterium]|nr:hypothetical protein [Candidatus Latescibacterota bacterium]
MFNFVTALAAEARPLIQRYRLVKTEADWPLYQGDGLQLIVAGVGRLATAAATAYLAGRTPQRPLAWLNIGIAGHGVLAVGTPLLAHKITDAQTVHFPAFPFRPPCATDVVHTVDQPETGYADKIAYDMEAAAFWPTACRFASAELVHCLKIVSDNPTQPADRLDAAAVAELVAAKLELVDQLHTLITPLAQVLAPGRQDPPFYAAARQRWRFSTAQQHQLRRLLFQWGAQSPEENPWDRAPAPLQSGSDALHFLRQRLAACPPPRF